MPTHQQTRDLAYSPAQVFALVAGIERYPEFVPGYRAARITGRTETGLLVMQEVGLGPFRQRFASVAVLDPPQRITIQTREGPFRHMDTEWRFEALERGCRVRMRSSWEFRSPGLALVADQWVHQFTQRIIDAFAARARVLYGEGEGA